MDTIVKTIYIITIEGMTCDSCALHNKTAISNIPGVISIEIPDYESGEARIVANKEITKEMIEKSHTFGSRSEKIIKIINKFYENPILSVKELVKITGIPDKTMRSLINVMIDKDIIKEMTGYGRNKLFVFDKYLKLF